MACTVHVHTPHVLCIYVACSPHVLRMYSTCTPHVQYGRRLQIEFDQSSIVFLLAVYEVRRTSDSVRLPEATHISRYCCRSRTCICIGICIGIDIDTATGIGTGIGTGTGTGIAIVIPLACCIRFDQSTVEYAHTFLP